MLDFPGILHAHILSRNVLLMYHVGEVVVLVIKCRGESSVLREGGVGG